MNTTSPRANYNYPTRYRLGAGRVAELAALCAERQIARPLIVTDPGVGRLPWFEALVGRLSEQGLAVAVYADVHQNPLAEDVEGGLRLYRSHRADAVLLIGGGSAMDAGKCVALLAENPGTLFDYEDVGDNYKRADGSKISPMIAVPTTAGTGSEVGRASVIINAAHEKKIIFHPQMLPPDVIADPELTVGLPPDLTGFTGIDAYVHCFEAFCAPGFHPMADGIALEGMRLIAENLSRAYRDGADIEARTHMLIASTMGATAFQKGLGVVHALSHALGGRLNMHHGLANAILLPYCMHFNRAEISAKCAAVARHLGLVDPTFDGLLAWTLALRAELGVPHALPGAANITASQVEELAHLALIDAALTGNPRAAGHEDLKLLLEKALAGDCS
jgi:alcohol dehydrogenase class IV